MTLSGPASVDHKANPTDQQRQPVERSAAASVGLLPLQSEFADQDGNLRCLRHANANTMAVSISGSGTIYFGRHDCTFRTRTFLSGGTRRIQASCSEVIANAITFNGNATLTRRVVLLTTIAYTQVVAFGAMMRKLDQRGVAAFEFCIVAVPFFTLIFAIFDLGRYAITMQSLRALANAGARAVMVPCELPRLATRMPNCQDNPASCSGDPLPSDTAKQAVAPFLLLRRSDAHTERVDGRPRR